MLLHDIFCSVYIFYFFLYKVRCNLGCMLYKILKFLLFFIRFELVGFRLACSSWTLLVIYVFLFGANRHYVFTTWSPFYCFFLLFCIALSSTWFVGLIYNFCSWLCFVFFLHGFWSVLILRCLPSLFVLKVCVCVCSSFCVAVDFSWLGFVIYFLVFKIIRLSDDVYYVG